MLRDWSRKPVERGYARNFTITLLKHSIPSSSTTTATSVLLNVRRLYDTSLPTSQNFLVVPFMQRMCTIDREKSGGRENQRGGGPKVRYMNGKLQVRNKSRTCQPLPTNSMTEIKFSFKSVQSIILT